MFFEGRLFLMLDFNNEILSNAYFNIKDDCRGIVAVIQYFQEKMKS